MTYLAQVQQTRTRSAVINLYARAVEAAPDDLPSVRRLADAALRSRDLKQAAAALRRVVAADPDDAVAWSNLAHVLLSLGDVDGALAAGRQAVELAPAHGVLHSGYGFALRASGDDERADAVFLRGYALAAESPHLARGVGQALIRRGDGHALAAHCTDLMRRMATTGWIIAQYTIALAMLGRKHELAELIDYDHMLRVTRLPVPDGFVSLDAFNRALRAEQERLGTVPSGGALDVVHGALRIPAGLQGAILAFGEVGAPASAALLRLFEAEQQAYEAAAVSRGDGLHLHSKPSEAYLVTETIITPRQGYIAPHTHACTWLSAVYYADVPIGLNGKEGSVEFAPPLHKINVPDGLWPSYLLRPEPGMLTLFPGYFYHHVYPTTAEGERVVVTFDVKPTQESRPLDAGRAGCALRPDQE